MFATLTYAWPASDIGRQLVKVRQPLDRHCVSKCRQRTLSLRRVSLSDVLQHRVSVRQSAKPLQHQTNGVVSSSEMHSPTVCMCVRVCVRACVRSCVRACVRA